MLRIWTMLALLAACLAAAASDGPRRPNGIFDADMLSAGFLSAHPDIRWQREAMHAYEEGRYGRALDWFKRAARHGDKLSQAMIASMYWDGVGVARDRALGYAWMDVAAERRYPDLLEFREAYWAELDRREREDALERGQEILAEYGDEAAQPRMEQALARERRRMTGSRTGSPGAMRVVQMNGPAGVYAGPRPVSLEGMPGLDGEVYYADRYWRPAQYQQYRAELWEAATGTPLPAGRVDVGDVEAVPGEREAGGD